MASDASVRDGEIVLSGEHNINQVGELREVLLRTIEVQQCTEVRLREIVEVDAAFLQLLCSAHRSAVESGKELRLQIEASPLFRQQLRDCGFIRHIGCRLDCNGSCIWVLAGECAGS